METIGSKRSYALIWCMPNNDDDDHYCPVVVALAYAFYQYFWCLAEIAWTAFSYAHSIYSS